MCIANVDDLEVNRFLVRLEQLLESAQEGPGRPSGEAVEDQHRGAFAEIVAQPERLLAVEILQLEVRCLVAGLRASSFETRPRLARGGADEQHSPHKEPERNVSHQNHPPVIGSTCPVMYDDSSHARNRMT